MSFNLFAPPSKDDIRVGYIDPTLGYVDGISICVANDYAKDNPGTTFIFRDGNNNIRYLNINEVNRLNPNSLKSTKNQCEGIQAYKECGPPRIQFFGGGGIGAVGNPVIGRDGSLLAVDLVSGGHGYQYSPIVAARDDCQLGNGAVLTAILGETVDEIEVFEGEEDFEEYELCEDTDVGYGRRYGPNGEDLGPWEPQTYTKIGADPIQREIEIFQKAIQKPFWTTRKTQPDRITALDTSYPQVYNVTFPDWGEFMNQYAVSPVKRSNTRGSDESGKVFSIEWELNFPVSGEYIFRGVSDNKSQVYIDGNLVGNLKGPKQNPSPLQKTIQAGNHILKIDLINNLPTVQKNTSSSAEKVDVNFTVKSVKSSTFASNFKISELGINVSKPPRTLINQTIPKKVEVGKVYTVEIEVPQSKGITLRVKGNTLEVEDLRSSTARDLFLTISNGRFFDIQNGAGKATCKFVVDGDEKSSSQVEEVISPKSWNENPMGVSMIIDAPIPPVPQEQPPVQTGRCPPNPIWSTRFPGSSQKWYPVRYTQSQSQYQFRQGPAPTNNLSVLGTIAINNAIADGLSVSQIRAEAQRQGLTLNSGATSILRASSSNSISPRTFGGQNIVWGKFMNRYAISPVLPLNTPGSDSSGVTFSNSWEVDLPYAGFYGVKGTRDNNGRLLIDGKEISSLDGFNVNNPKLTKVYLSKGRHTITVEVFNNPVETTSTIDTKIFSTQDWRVSPTQVAQKTDIDFNYRTVASSTLASYFRIPELGIDVYKPTRTGLNQTIPKKVEVGKVYTIEFEVPNTSGSVKININGKTLIVEDLKSSSARDLFLTISNGRFFDVQNGRKKATCKFVVDGTGSLSGLSQGTSKKGVTYSGPELFFHTDKRWSKYMNEYSVSPLVFNDINTPDERVVGKYTLTWKKVNFPQDGVYKFNLQGDNIVTFKVGDREIFKTGDFSGGKVQYTFNVTAGKYDVVIELENIRSPTNDGKDTIFSINPMGVALYISKDISFRETNKTPWTTNPMAVSAILIPPPCAKKIGGKGVVERVIVEDPGNGYLPPQGDGYPATLVLDQVIVENPGINYRCGEDQIVITPNNGAELSYDCDPFGKIRSVSILNPGSGFNVYPEISIPSETGVNASFRPVFRVIRDPLLPPEQLIQVTDLVGLKQTGYVNGRAYYGAVYYDAGVPFAGYYKTAGPQTRVYATLQESITAQVTTPPSAIQRSGTDVTSNDPRLNIPGTIEDTQT